jgi:hypothetical protein
MAAGTSNVTVYYADTLVGGPTLTAAASGLTSGTQTQGIFAAPATRLSFTTSSQTVTAGNCSASTGFRTEDAYGNLSAVGAATVVNTTSSAGTGAFFSDPGCTAQVSGVLVGAGGSSGSFYFRDTTAGSPTLTLSASGFSSAGQTETIVAGAAVQLAFANGPITMTAGGCGGALTVQARDLYGNPRAVSSATVVTLSSTSGTGTFYTAAGCGTATGTVTIAAGSSSATVYYGDVTAGTPTATAAAGGFTAGTQTVTVNAGSATRLAISSAAQTLTAGGCSGATVAQSRDSLNNPTNVSVATVVNLASTSTGNTF